jgi:hypothetical protein
MSKKKRREQKGKTKCLWKNIGYFFVSSQIRFEYNISLRV